jgi:glycosyltransferase involved in cell wall biosynthesis
VKVSVVIPVYNDEKCLKNCLKALSEQEESADEIIVIDNNCTDKSIEVAASYPGIKIFKEPRQGIIPARNKGFSQAKYEILIKCDTDTIPPKYWVGRIKDDFKNLQIDALGMPAYLYGLGPFNGSFIWSAYRHCVNSVFKCEVLYGACYAIKKSVWEKIKKETSLNDEEVHEDVELSVLLKKNGFKISYDNSLIIKASGRLVKRPYKLLKYSIKLVKTYLKSKK